MGLRSYWAKQTRMWYNSLTTGRPAIRQAYRMMADLAHIACSGGQQYCIMEGSGMKLVTYCGLYCDLCAERARIPHQAAALQAAMVEEGWPFWGPSVPGFTDFWSFLEGLASGEGCPGCRAGGGFPGCQIRVCARERGLDLCSQCADFACEHVEALAARYPTLIADNVRVKAVGLEQWIVEQEERARRGVVYADIRYRVEDPADPNNEQT